MRLYAALPEHPDKAPFVEAVRPHRRRVHVPRKMRRAAMKLYDLKTGTNTRRVRIFLAEKGLKLPTVEVDMLKGENK
jgi:hypothetical protein